MWYVKTIRSGKRYEDGSLPPEVWQQGGVCPTLNAFDNGSESRATVLVDGMEVRRLTPVECERLQGFPDNWTEGLADSHRYKQMGNAVTVNVANYVGLLIMEAASEYV
jgi:site-specific DNA-cytosine methylase